MTILFPSVCAVKSRRFGRGILPTHPVARLECSIADMEWLAADNARREARDRAYDRLAMEAAAADRIETGLCF